MAHIVTVAAGSAAVSMGSAIIARRGAGMIAGLAVLLVFQLLGEGIVAALALPVPGPVVGMMLLFAALLIRRGPPAPLAKASRGLLDLLSLLFVPAGTGIVAYLALIRQEWLPITVSLLGSTLITLTVTALVMQAVARSRGGAARRRAAGAGLEPAGGPRAVEPASPAGATDVVEAPGEQVSCE